MFHIVFGKLISNSNINFETYKVLDLSLYSAAGYISVIFFLLLPASFISKAFQAGGRITAGKLIIPVIVSIGLIAAILYREPLPMAALVFLWTWLILLGWFSQSGKPWKTGYFGHFFTYCRYLCSGYDYSLFGEENQ